MKSVYSILLILLGLVAIVSNRFAVEETVRVMPNGPGRDQQAGLAESS
jgi:hypothetical protein